jgi:hypothetical protein
MTRNDLRAVHEALAELIASSNQAAADDDRGPKNEMLVIMIGDDGSGAVGRRTGVADCPIVDLRFFDDLEELAGLFECEGLEFEPTPASKSMSD